MGATPHRTHSHDLTHRKSVQVNTPSRGTLEMVAGDPALSLYGMMASPAYRPPYLKRVLAHAAPRPVDSSLESRSRTQECRKASPAQLPHSAQPALSPHAAHTRHLVRP